MRDLGPLVTPAVVGGVVSFVVSTLSNALSYRAKVDEGLRDTRLALYRVLWKKTEILPKWPHRTDVTYEKLHELSEELRNWYFGDGGIFLSRAARRAYGKLQDTVGEIVTQRPKGAIIDLDYEEVRLRCSDLRTQLTEDLLSRRGARRWF
jgi:hypothetical protein